MSETTDQVLSIISNIKNKNEVSMEDLQTQDDEVLKNNKTKSIEIKGRPKSGRFWKSSRDK